MEIQPLHTKVDKTIQTSYGTIVLEDPIHYPRSESNLYCVDQDGQVVWHAERPDPNTHYSKLRFGDDGLSLSTYTLGGHACDVDLETGKILSQTSIQ